MKAGLPGIVEVSLCISFRTHHTPKTIFFAFFYVSTTGKIKLSAMVRFSSLPLHMRLSSAFLDRVTQSPGKTPKTSVVAERERLLSPGRLRATSSGYIHLLLHLSPFPLCFDYSGIQKKCWDVAQIHLHGSLFLVLMQKSIKRTKRRHTHRPLN